MVKVVGFIRRMGIDGFERLIVDLLYCRRTFNETVERYVASSLTLPEDSIFKSFIKRPTLEGFAIIDNEEKIEKLLLGNDTLYDRSGISLSDFIRHRSQAYVWGNENAGQCWWMRSQIFKKYWLFSTGHITIPAARMSSLY